MKHSEAGLLGMCKRGGLADTNECQFYITLGAPLSFMDNTHVVFGRVVNGMRTVRMIEKMDTVNERPSKKVEVASCGVYSVSESK